MNSKISAAILAKIQAGATVREAIDAVLGAGTSAKAIGEVYDILHAAAAPAPAVQTLKIGKRSFTVTRIERDNCQGPDRIGYELRGVRGALYQTMRNAHRPEIMFLVSPTRVDPLGEGLRLTDSGGVLAWHGSANV